MKFREPSHQEKKDTIFHRLGDLIYHDCFSPHLARMFPIASSKDEHFEQYIDPSGR